VYRYDAAGKLLQSTFGADRILYRYDKLGRLDAVVINAASGEETISETYRYDEGTKRKFQKLSSPPAGVSAPCLYGVGVEGSTSAYPAPGGAAIIMTVFDESDRPVELQFQADTGRVLRRIVLRYDEAGNLLEETQKTQSDISMDDLPMPGQITEPQLDAMRRLMGEGWTRSYTYDELGRLVEDRTSTGSLGGEWTTLTYNQQGDRATETSHRSFARVDIQEDGTLVRNPEVTPMHHNELRYEYQYDDHGNWTERITSCRGPDQTFMVCSAERRTISYY
jgi:hypothetical protein